MSRFTELESEYDDHTMLVGLIRLDDENRVEYQSFYVIVWIRGMDKDITKAFNEKEIADFKKSFELAVLNKHWEDLKYVHLSDRMDEGA